MFLVSRQSWLPVSFYAFTVVLYTIVSYLVKVLMTTMNVVNKWAGLKCCVTFGRDNVFSATSLSVCLFVCKQDDSESFGWIFVKLVE